jgi:hypothetical protein
VTCDELEFAIFCVESVAEACGIGGNEVYQLMENCPGLRVIDDYIIPCCSVLHTQGQGYIVNELIELMRRKGSPI